MLKAKVIRGLTVSGLAVLLFVACRAQVAGMTDDAAQRSRVFFADASVAHQMRAFCRYTLEEQYDIFLYGNQIRHPPAQYLARCFALNGASGVQVLRTKLRDAKDDLTIRDIVRLLSEIDAMNTYNVAGDFDLMRSAAERVSHMSDPGWKNTALELLNEIGKSRESSRGNAPRCCDGSH